MTFKGLARFASRLFGFLVVGTLVVTAVLMVRSYNETVEPVEGVNLINGAISRYQETVDEQDSTISQLRPQARAFSRRCADDLVNLEVERPKSCLGLENLERQISQAEDEKEEAEAFILSKELEREPLRAKVAAEVAYQQSLVLIAVSAFVPGTALWIAFTLVLLWRKESTGWKK